MRSWLTLPDDPVVLMGHTILVGDAEARTTTLRGAVHGS